MMRLRPGVAWLPRRSLSHHPQGAFMQYQFTVEGMTCGHCERAVVHAVREVDTDAIVKVDLASKQVSVESDKARDAIANAIREEGYQVSA